MQRVKSAECPMMSAKGDFPAARTRNQLGSEGDQQSTEGNVEQIAEEHAEAVAPPTPKEVKEKTRRKTGPGKRSKKSNVSDIPSISKFLTEKVSENSQLDNLRSRSISGMVYTTTLLVQPSESESETCDGHGSLNNSKQIMTSEPTTKEAQCTLPDPKQQPKCN